MNTKFHTSTDLRIGRFEKTLRILIALICAVSFLGFAQVVSAAGNTQIGGDGYFDAEGECTDAEGAGADFALVLTGDLAGCYYITVESYECRPSGTYIERGTELYVGDGVDGNVGTFGTTYVFTGKFDDCSTLAGQQFGRCQHPIVEGSGTGDFTGVKGRLDFKDDVVAGTVEYRGHLKFN